MRDFASACFGCMSKTESAKSEKEQTLRDNGRPGDGSRRFYNRTSAVVAHATGLQPHFGGNCACHRCHGVGEPTPC